MQFLLSPHTWQVFERGAFRAPRAPEIPISFDPFERLPRRLSLFDYHEAKIVLDTQQSRVEKTWDCPAFNFLMCGKLLMV